MEVLMIFLILLCLLFVCPKIKDVKPEDGLKKIVEEIWEGTEAKDSSDTTENEF